MTLDLLIMFVKLSLLGFGGGYAIIPIIMSEVEAHQWASAASMADTIAIGAMSPGPVAVNVSIGLGFLLNGFPGIVAAFVGTTIPCILVVWAVAAFFMKANDKPAIQGILYGLKAVIPGIIFFAAIKMGMQNNMFWALDTINHGANVTVSYWNFELKSLVLIVITLLLLLKTKIHPIVLIVASAVAGILLF